MEKETLTESIPSELERIEQENKNKENLEKKPIIQEVVVDNKEQEVEETGKVSEEIKEMDDEEENQENKLGFNVDPKYSFDQKEKIEKYTEAINEEIKELARLGRGKKLAVGLIIGEKQAEMDSIIEIAGKKKFFGGRDKMIIGNLRYKGIPSQNAYKMVKKIKAEAETE